MIVPIQALQNVYKSSLDRYSDMRQQLQDANVRVATEKTQFFEKIALGGAGGIAAIVSFLGAHASVLRPNWLLRSVLIALAFTSLAALYRNWRYPYYLLTAYKLNVLIAARESNSAKKRLVESGTVRDIDSGAPIDPSDYDGIIENDKRSVEEVRSETEQLWERIKRIELATLFLAMLSVAGLIALAWVNF